MKMLVNVLERKFHLSLATGTVKLSSVQGWKGASGGRTLFPTHRGIYIHN